ncbi:MAG TPA: M48 family metallopeptidase [Pyrinomonadaceae bacterium]|nr:M48 family metallopeptidase [Pyrinomonadaceae bacterium]
MPMTHEEFVEKVNRLEEFAGREPSKYALRVGLLAALGYAYIVLMLALAALLIYGLLYLTFAGARFNFYILKFGWVLLMLAYVVVRALWVSVPAPEGIGLDTESAPRLKALVAELSGSLQAPRVHRVLVNDEYNAALAQVPRLGPLGWHRNYLVLGLPLMQALSPEQFRAVIAHELGHLSGNHGRFASWIYRVRQTWFQLLYRLEQEGRWGAFVFFKFFNWYAPYFNAYSFVLARRHEYEADSAAAQLTGARTAAEALATVDVKGAFLSEKYWPEVFKSADTQAEPARGAYARMQTVLREALPQQDASAFLLRALSRETGYDDTHPSLAARLAALGFETNGNNGGGPLDGLERRQFEPLAENAADFYLGPELHRSLVERLDADWAEAVRPHWRQRFEYARESQQKLAALEEKARAEELTLEEAWERAYWTAEFKDPEESLPLLREIVARKADHAPANFALGQMLLEREDEAGVAHVERAMESDHEFVAPGCEAIYGFLRRHGRDEEAEIYRKRLFSHYDLLERAGQERAVFKDGDALIPHGLTPEEVAGLRAQVRRYYRDIKRAYLARKQTEHLSDVPLYVLGIEIELSWYQSSSEEFDRELLNKLIANLEFKGETFIVILNNNFKKTKKALAKLEGALIYGD